MTIKEEIALETVRSVNEPLSVVFNEDCMEGMKRYPEKYFDLAVVDPPYGIGRDKGFGGSRGFNGRGNPITSRKYQSEWDSTIPPKEYFDNLLKCSSNTLIFGGNFFSHLLPSGKHWVVWDKKNTMPTFGDAELIWTNIDRNSVKIYECEWNGLLGKEKQPRIHPTQKPVKLYEWILLNYAKQGEKILDTHVGSGSSRIAAYKHGFDYVGFEIDKDYFEAQEKRFNEFKAQLTLF